MGPGIVVEEGRLMGGWEMKTTSCFLRDPHHIPYVSALRI